MEVNTTSAREQIPEIERLIWLIKERLRCITCDFTFTSVPKMVLIHSLYSMIIMLNVFPHESGFTGELSPCKIVTGMTTNYLKDCRMDIGAYVEASMDAMVTNDHTSHTHSCIALGLSINRQGSLKFFDLDTGKVVLRRTFTQMPYPERMVKQANYWGLKSKSAIVKGEIKIFNRHGKKFDLDNDELSELDVFVEEPKKILPDHIAEVSRIELESEYDQVVGSSVDP